jgi:sialidase-1
MISNKICNSMIRKIIFITVFLSVATSQLFAQAVQNEELQDFLGDSLFLTQQLWEGRGGTSVITAQNGTVLVFHGRNDMIRPSYDGGGTWLEERSMGADFGNGNAVLDETNGHILFINPGSDGQGRIMRSQDHGETWQGEDITVHPDGFGLQVHSVGSMQAGITLIFGEHAGRLIMPGRVFGPENSNDVEWRAFHYSTALYSDDGGLSWQTSDPFPVFGTGEAALAEISDGSIMYNSREHMSVGNRFIACSDDGGHIWTNPYRSSELYDGARGSSYGCMGGMIRLPVNDYDILVYSNLDTEAGKMPGDVGGSNTKDRENISVWVSFDGGKTWPVKRLVYEGPSGYSNLGVGRAGTDSAGRIYLLYEGGPEGRNSAVQVAVFNLSWILNGEEINDYLPVR